VDTLADAGQARREHLVAGLPQRAPDLAEAVCATPRAMYQNKDRHLFGPFQDPAARSRWPVPSV
jgi:hypothetical protein